jgi:2-C-methyl-D-erythritol 4-phosphate cytidylyltransferase/2-C-methyl-D-erythritol 2,4-cyclodiphosphate synthase|tara:strand:+ start:480 stop:1637 length:1158 start_codon:yes stop_codon:yes gene_type:complete
MNHNNHISVIIPAAGNGSRFKAEKPKQYCMLGSQTILEKTVSIFLDIPEVQIIYIAVHPDDQFINSQSFANHPKILIIKGGVTRIQSVFNAASKINAEDSKSVLIHDAVRPWLQLSHLSNLLNEFHSNSDWDGIYPGITVSDSLREKRDNKFIPVDRASFLHVQTPQIFKTAFIQDALNKAINSGKDFTDETQAMEFANYRIKSVPGDPSNHKVTFPHDLRMHEISDARIGRGIDFHKLEPGNGMTLASIFLESNLSIVAHSDGDIALHALADALLGAGGLNDIGYYFPDTDAANKNLSSMIILDNALSLLEQKKLKPRNVDLVIICEQPKITPHVKTMKIALSNLLKIDEGDISIKATTAEGMGIIGEGNGIAVYAIASLMEAK